MANKAVNDFILAMNYDKKKLLTHQGESIENRFIKEGNQLPDEFVVIERKKRSLSTNTSDISVTATNDSRLYPGALLVVDETLLENNPTLLAVDRAPMTYSIDLPGLASSDSFLQVEDPSNSSVRGAVNDLLAKWHQDYGQVNNVPARMQYEKITAHSMEQLKVKFGSDFEKTGNSLDIDFNSVHSGEKQIQIVNFKQIYYTVSVDAVKNPGDVFQDTVTVEDLKQRGISAERPLVYISSVAYGRQVYLKLETTSKSDEVEAAFEALIKGVKVAPQTEWKQILDNTEVKAVILGGDPSSGARVVTGKVDMVEDLIQEGSRFTADHPGLPISYTTSFLRDNVVATFQNSTDYVETKVTAYRNGDLLLDHSGAYVAQYYITWDELSYDHQGKEVLTPKAWDRNGQDLTAHFTTSIPLKGNVRNLSVKIRECTGLAWEWWRTVYEKTDLPLVCKRTISIWGTTLYPQVEDKVEND